MRVLFWTETFLPIIGGVEVMGSSFLRALSRRGFQFTILTSQVTPDLDSYPEYEGMPVHRLPFESALANRDIEQLARFRSTEIRAVAAKKLERVPFGAVVRRADRDAPGSLPRPDRVLDHRRRHDAEVDYVVPRGQQC